MKRVKNGTLMALCSLTLAFIGFFHYSGNSLLFFGEPKYPTED